MMQRTDYTLYSASVFSYTLADIYRELQLVSNLIQSFSVVVHSKCSQEQFSATEGSCKKQLKTTASQYLVEAKSRVKSDYILVMGTNTQL